MKHTHKECSLCWNAATVDIRLKKSRHTIDNDLHFRAAANFGLLFFLQKLEGFYVLTALLREFLNHLTSGYFESYQMGPLKKKGLII